jgi:CubicO group peptidase (beta-lactamase class C family)
VPDSRLARVVLYNPGLRLLRIPRSMLGGLLNPQSLFARSLLYPRDGNINSRSYLRVEQPSVNGVGEVRLVARAYSEFAIGGRTLGIGRRTLDEIETSPVDPPAGPIDAVLRESSYFRLGFAKPGPNIWFGSSEKAYGMPGLGGSVGFADPDKQLGFAYAPNRLGYNLGGDNRRRALAAAAYRCIARLEQPR